MEFVIIIGFCILIKIIEGIVESKKLEEQKKYYVPVCNGTNRKEVLEAMTRQREYYFGSERK